MTVKTFPQKPYFDDYDETKDYLRVLFRPGYAVQTREVNQMQTILQNQISRMGDHFFEEGARVVRGEASLNNSFDYVTVSGTPARDASAYAGATIYTSNGTKAKIIFAVAASGSDLFTFYIQYTVGGGSSGVNQVTGTFSILNLDGTIENLTAAAYGKGAVVSLDSGIYYLSGEFVYIPTTYSVLKKYSAVGAGEDYSLGFVVTHTIVTDADDSSLFDNAGGTSNFAAPGAHRYKINAVFGVKPTNGTVTNYTEIVRVQDGAITSKVRNNDYTVFQEELATRTYEESGDYTVDEFSLQVREHLDTGSNNGVYTAANGGLESKVVYTLDPGKAYVRGFPVQTVANTYLSADKSRTIHTHSNTFMSLPYVSTLTVSTTAQFSIGQGLTLIAGSTNVGTAVVRDIGYSNSNAITLDLVNISTNAGYGLSDVTSVNQSGAVGTVTATNYDSTNSMLVYQLPYGYVNNLQSAALHYRKTFVYTATGTNQVVLSGGDAFSANRLDYTCRISVGGVFSWVAPQSVVLTSGGTVATLTLPSVPTSSTTVTVYGAVLKTSATARTKTEQTASETVSASGNLKLSHTDITSITSITIGGVDVTSTFKLDNGQRDTVYDYGKLIATSNSPTTGNLTVTYKYYQHSSGDFFCKNSYSVAYGSIPTYTTTSGESIFLGSAIDFRRSVSGTNVDFENGFASSFIANTEVVTSFQVYESRYDKIVIDKFGKISVVTGIPASAPEIPKDIDNAMTLYTILVNPYTFSAADMAITKSDNMRYTMKDIGKIDKRVSTVEYYTTLNMLEKRILESDYVGKFNTGFLVDNFSSQAVSDITQPDLSVSYDFVNGAISAQTPKTFVGLYSASGTNVAISSSGFATKAYTNASYINQPLATELQRIQPYIRFDWLGDVSLTPSSDSWVSTTQAPTLYDNTTITWWGSSTTTRVSWADVVRLGSTITSQTTTSTSVPAQYIRARAVAVNGVGFKPSTRVYPFFDNVDVSAYCTPVGGVAGGAITTAGNGTVSFTFNIPETAAVKFLVGERKLEIRQTPVSGSNGGTYGFATYSASGVDRLTQTKVNTTNIISPPPVVNTDPVAESFSIGSDLGAFITQIDLFFGPTNNNAFPVTVELRGMDNGYPAANVIAKSTLAASSIVGSVNGSAPTTFTFDRPIYLEGNKEYCFVVRTDSDVLTLWTAVLGEKNYLSTDTTYPTGEVVSKQSYLGSMFRSQNNTTWTAEQTSDIKFNLYRAVFSSSTATLQLANGVPSFETTNAYTDTLDSPLSTTSGSNIVVVNHPNHGMITGRYVTLTGSSGIAGIPPSELFGIQKVITKIDCDSYSIQTTTSANATSFGGGTIIATSSVSYSGILPKFSEFVPHGSKIAHTVTTKASGSSVTTATSVTNGVPKWFNTLQESISAGDNSITATITLDGDNNFVSPIVDVNASGIVCQSNRISASSTNKSKAVYYQKPITLKSAADGFITYFDCSRPPGTDVQMYYRVAQDSVADVAWTLATPTVSGYTTADSTTEFKYEVNTSSYYVIQIKLVFWSDSEVYSPVVSNMRTITLKA
jgi:hypothetical protein